MSDSTYLLTLYGGNTGSSADSLLKIIYNSGTTTPGTGTAYGITPGSNPVVALQQAQATQSAGVAYEAKQPLIEQTLARFTAAVKSATSVQQLLSNPAVLTVLLTANNLASQVSFTALAQKALTSDPSDPNSLVNQLTDTDWKSAAETYQFATQGLSVIQSPATLSTLTSAYTEVMWRQSLDNAVPGLSNALSFKQEASTITSVDQILGDYTLRTVVTGALGIPEQIAFQPLEAQEKAISSRLDITKFQDPNFVNTFVQQYLLSVNNGASSSSGMIV
jgi:hypothetical protein